MKMKIATKRSIRWQACRAVVLLTVALFLGVSAQAAIVSVNQVNNTTDTRQRVGLASAAEGDQFAGAPGYIEDYWNDLGTGVHSGSLLDSNGSAVSGLSVTLANQGGNANWSLTSWPDGNDDNMMWGTLAGLSGAAAVTVSGIPYAQYDLVVYNLPDGIQFGTVTGSVRLTIGTTSTTVTQSLSGLPTGFTTFDVIGNPGGTIPGGNFNTIIFRGLTASSFSFRGAGNGFQIVEVTGDSGGPTATGPIISEFMAANSSVLADVDGEYSDWIELHNPTATAVNLNGWYLTDAVTKKTKWRIPNITLNSGAFRIIFASGKNRINPAAELHTNFSLTSTGEYLALVRPDGITVEDDFGTMYPPQDENISFGNTFTFYRYLTKGSAGRYLVPDSASPDTATWTARTFADGAWPAGNNGYGFGLVSGGVAPSAIATNLQTPMMGVRASSYVRLPFTVATPSGLETLAMNIRYNDGFVAWLNGTEVARRQAPAVPDWQSAAQGTARSLTESLTPEAFDLSAFKNLLVTGPNVLAIQGLNNSASDNSFLIQPELLSGIARPATLRFFTQPSPGTINSTPGVLGIVADTVFSHKRGLYNAPFTLTINCATPGATIRYTTDGTKPTANTGTAVLPADANTPPVASILVNSTRFIRVAAFKSDFLPTNVDTNTYLFLDDVITQSPTGAAPAGWPSGTVSGQIMNYGMDPGIVNHVDPAIGGAVQVKNALSAIPSICISLPVGSLTDGSTGIYTHASEDGAGWEREASIEMLNDPNTLNQGFQENCGLRIRGGYSRSGNNPKHAFRILFSNDYGAGKLNYPLFHGDNTATNEFDKFDIQTAQNYSWSFEGSTQNVFLREVFSRDSQLALKSPGTRGRFVHLYLNAIYWGLFQIQERPEADWAKRYFGGTDEDYDVVKVEASNYPNYTVYATAGDVVAYQNMWNQSRAHYNAPTLTNYRRLLGRNPDGTPSTTNPVLVDLDNLIDYLAVVHFTGNSDSPLNGSEIPNNFYCVRDRRGGKGFIQIQHDGEHSMDRGSTDRTGPLGNPVTGAWNNIQKSNPQFTHQDLMGSATAPDKSGALEYKTYWGDRIYKHFYNDGAMTLAKCLERLDLRAAQVESVIIAESARWGDSKVTPARTANDWRTAKDNLRNWVINRHATVISQWQADGLFPTVNAPTYSQHGGPISSTAPVSLTGGGEPVYYTLNGADPREVGGALLPAATLFQSGQPINLPGPGIVRAQARSRTAGGQWSALNAVEFLVNIQEAAPGNLVISEIMYHPTNPSIAEQNAGFTTEGFFEYIEIMNIGPQTIDLRGCYWSGIDYAFPNTDNAVLAAGARMVLAKNIPAMNMRYPGVQVFGDFGDSLDNSGETLTLRDPSGTVIKSVTYGQAAGGWPAETDGDGHSLILKQPETDPAPNNPANYRGSVAAGGNPGTSDAQNYPAWKTAHSITDDNGDGDMDGITNFMEYVLGTSPATANLIDFNGGIEDYVVPPDINRHLTLHLRCNAGADDVALTGQLSTDLTIWDPAQVTWLSSVNHGDGTKTLTWRATAQSNAPRQFIRAKAQLVP